MKGVRIFGVTTVRFFHFPGNLPMMKPDDMQYFDKLLQDVDEESLTPDEQKERKIMKLLLKIKNGTPPMRKVSGNVVLMKYEMWKQG